MHMFIRFCSLTLTPPKLCLTFGNASPVDLFTFELNSLGRAPYIHTRPAVQKLQYTHCQDCHNLIIMFSATHVHAVVPTPVSFWFCSFYFLHTSSCCKEHCAHCSWCALKNLHNFSIQSLSQLFLTMLHYSFRPMHSHSCPCPQNYSPSMHAFTDPDSWTLHTRTFRLIFHTPVLSFYKVASAHSKFCSMHVIISHLSLCTGDPLRLPRSALVSM